MAAPAPRAQFRWSAAGDPPRSSPPRRRPRRRARAAAASAALALLAGCGSQPVAELPPPAGPAASPPLQTAPEGTLRRGTLPPPQPPPGVEVLRRARELVTPQGRAPAGVGPTTAVAGEGGILYVADTAGDGVLVFRTRPGLEQTRRVAVPGGAPYAMAVDPVHDRLWVTLTASNEVAELTANAKPGVIARHPSVRQPDAVAVDPETGTVTVAGAGGELQVLNRRTR